MHEALERVDLDQAFEQRGAFLACERRTEGSRLDVLAQPHALAVRGDVLDLVCDRPAVGLAQVRQRVGERPARHVHAQDARRNLRHQRGREADRLGFERGIALRLGAERVEPRREVTVRSERLQQSGGGLHGLKQRFARGRCWPRNGGRRWQRRRRGGGRRRGPERD